jgi:WD40 repeat protein
LKRIAAVLVPFVLLLAVATGALAAKPFPNVIALPDGWLPEGVAVGKGHTFYSGSRANGAVYAGDLRTGAGSIVVPGTPGRIAVGLKVDQHGRIFVAGGGEGTAYVYGSDGAELRAYTLAPGFINDVVVTRSAAWFTNSSRAEVYRVDIAPDGTLATAAVTVPLTGDWEQVAGFNANGIDATPNGDQLVVVNSTTGKLYLVDAATGIADEIDLGSATVTMGDGILLEGKTLFVVRNRLNLVAVIDLAADLRSGSVVDEITSANFDIPTTVARFGNRLVLVNARFTTPPTPTTTYTAVTVPRSS